MTTIKDMIADHAMGKFVSMDADELIDTMVKLVNSTPEVAKKEYKTKFVLKDKKKEEETKPKKEDN
ncbi:hypothetical protein ENUP19_0051G0046 [Entamoeba nuttalli]|uniref:Uncharacterized protein n=1 Tax=Entamoeba nuttalli TaxID=412467 RepID=A0ABQ0DBW7_9EUKA